MYKVYDIDGNFVASDTVLDLMRFVAMDYSLPCCIVKDGLFVTGNRKAWLNIKW